MSVRSARSDVGLAAAANERECTRRTPGTMLTASSIGRVMLNTTWRAPSDDPCATIVMRGKDQLGIDGGRQLRRGPDAGRAQERDREIDESALRRPAGRTASPGGRRRRRRVRRRLNACAVLHAVGPVRHHRSPPVSPLGDLGDPVGAPAHRDRPRACAMPARSTTNTENPSPLWHQRLDRNGDGVGARCAPAMRPNDGFADAKRAARERVTRTRTGTPCETVVHGARRRPPPRRCRAITARRLRFQPGLPPRPTAMRPRFGAARG